MTADGYLAVRRLKSWFKLPGQAEGQYERTLQDQLIGLRPIIDEIRAAKTRGRPMTVLDVGCGEGLIAIEMARHGAAHVHGLEALRERVRIANRLRASMPCTFEVGRVDYYRPRRPYDVLLALSILHKMPNPSTTLQGLAHMCDRHVVIRLPAPTDGRPGYVVVDRRSGNRPHDLNEVLMRRGWSLVEETAGPRGEWCGYWRMQA